MIVLTSLKLFSPRHEVIGMKEAECERRGQVQRTMHITESQGCLVVTGRRARAQLLASDYSDRSCASHFNT